MRHLYPIMLILTLASCGGSGDSTPSDDSREPTSSNSAPELPAITDNLEDGYFVYRDYSLYQGEYRKTSDDTCSTFFTEPMSDTVSVPSINYLEFTLRDGGDFRFLYYPVNDKDVYAYYGDLSPALCVFQFFSMPVTNYTADVFSIICGDENSYEICATFYIRPNEYDFSNTMIKSMPSAKDDATALWHKIYSR